MTQFVEAPQPFSKLGNVGVAPVHITALPLASLPVAPSAVPPSSSSPQAPRISTTPSKSTPVRFMRAWYRECDEPCRVVSRAGPLQPLDERQAVRSGGGADRRRTQSRSGRILPLAARHAGAH